MRTELSIRYAVYFDSIHSHYLALTTPIAYQTHTKAVKYQNMHNLLEIDSGKMSVCWPDVHMYLGIICSCAVTFYYLLSSGSLERISTYRVE